MKRTALIVDDSRAMRLVMGRYLKELGYEVTDSLVVYGEIYGQNRVDTERYWQTSFDAGFMYSITPNVIFDAGANWFFRGDEAINPFVGLSWRF